MTTHDNFVVTIRHRERGKDDPTPWQADVYLPSSGHDYHAIGKTPPEALAELAIFWRAKMASE